MYINKLTISLYLLYMVVLVISLIMMSFTNVKPVERDIYGNDVKILKIKVIMGDENIRTVEELIQDYHEAYH